MHHRASGSVEKDIDRSYNIVTVVRGTRELVVEGMAAIAYATSELADQPIVALTCPRCGQPHIDEQKFATQPHRKHLCNTCGRNFHDPSGPSVSNPLADAYTAVGLAAPPAARPVARTLVLRSRDYEGIAIWPSNQSLLSTMSRPEEVGIHVHAWNEDSSSVIDETYREVVLDGEIIDQVQLRWLAVYNVLAHGAPIVAQACAGCGQSLLSPTRGWIEPRTTHDCVCGAVSRTRLRVFLNPLAAKTEL